MYITNVNGLSAIACQIPFLDKYLRLPDLMKKIGFILILFLTSCEFVSITPNMDRYAHIKDNKAREIIKKAIIYSGGLDKWDAKKSLGYSKSYTLFSADGAVEKQVRQMHTYQYTPLHIDIKSTENNELIHTIQQTNSYQQTKYRTIRYKNH